MLRQPMPAIAAIPSSRAVPCQPALISMMRTGPEVAGEELLEAAIAFVTRAQGVTV